MKHVEEHFLACWPAFTEEVDTATECQVEWLDAAADDDDSDDAATPAGANAGA